MITADRFVNAARAYVGTPWRQGACDSDGMDCFGLLLAAAADCGLQAPTSVTYGALPDLSLFDDLLPRYCDRARDFGLGALLRLSVAGRAQHLGIVGRHPAGGWSLIHAYMTVGRVAEHALDARWEKRIVSAWRVRGVGE